MPEQDALLFFVSFHIHPGWYVLERRVLLTEILKQDQFKPVPIEEQVRVAWARQIVLLVCLC